MKFVLGAVLLFSAVLTVRGHSYHLGGCPQVEPQQGFNMRQMLGIWYVIQKTSTGSSCIIYNFTSSNEPDEYDLKQTSQHFALGLTPLKHEYNYEGHIKVIDPSVPGKMSIKFPLSVAGTATYTVFMTDYDNYAAIFSCQKLTGVAHRQSVSILSRTRSLDKLFVDKIRSRISSYGIDPFDLSIINQKDCPKDTDEGVNINIDDDTFSAQSVAGVVRKAGEKIGDGIEYVATGAKNLYNKASDKLEESHQTTDKSGKVLQHPDSEWLP